MVREPCGAWEVHRMSLASGGGAGRRCMARHAWE